MSKKFLSFLIIFLTVFGFLVFNFREVEKIEAAPDTLTLRPNLAGTYQAWTLVGSTHPVATSDQSNTSYVYTLNTTSKETENLVDTAQTGTISQVTAYIRAKAPFGIGATEGANILWRTYNTDYESVAFIISRTAFTDYSQTRLNNPNTNVAWTWTEVNALQVGARASALGLDEEIDVSEFWIVVDYTPAGGITPPTVTTSDATNLLSTSAILNGNITLTNGQNADQRGFDIGTASGNYNLTGYLQGTLGTYVYGTGVFSWNKTGLNPSTPYYFRAKAHNSAGWTYATDEKSFTTPAAGCSLPPIGDYTLNCSLTLSGAIHLIGGNLTIVSGGTLNVPTGSSLIIDATYKILISGGTINMQGGQIFIGI